MSFADKVLKTSDTPIHFVRATDREGRKCHFFVKCATHRIKALEELVGVEGGTDLTKYGSIVASGFGRDPSEETLAMLKKDYNYEYKPNN